MALHFSANQYDKNFNPKLLQNWEVSHLHRERPRAFLGFTQIIANDRGHLLQGVKRSRESPWGTFMGTYDIPMRIPGNNMLNNTARTENATLRLQKLKTDGDIVLGGKLKRCKVPSPLPVKADIDADKTISPKAVPSETNLRRSLSGNGDRSGARNPEPKSSVAIAQSPGVTGKPRTPNLAWPRPASQVTVPRLKGNNLFSRNARGRGYNTRQLVYSRHGPVNITHRLANNTHRVVLPPLIKVKGK